MLLAAERSSRTPAQSLKCFVAPADFASQRESGWLESAWGTSWCCRNGAGRWCGADRRIADPVGAAADERCTSAASHGKPAAGGTSCRGPRETLVADEHRVRLVWSFVEGLDLAALYSTIKAVEGQPGHPPADPRILLALWLYATVQGIGSARELARLCE